MIRVSFEDNQIVLRGHAEPIGDEGTQICAVTSALLQTWWLVRGEGPPETPDGVSWIWADDEPDTVFVLTGLGMLALQYPQHVEIDD